MADQLAYALITPYSLYKSRTGGILARILANSKLDFVGARMYVFSDRFIDTYKQIVCPPGMDQVLEQAWKDYLDTNLRQDNPWGALPRAMFLLFRGPNAVRRLKEEVIGGFTEQPVGYTVRGTFGDYIRYPSGEIKYFEPAVITCPDPDLNDQHLKLFADYACSDGGVLTDRIQYDEPGEKQVSLVLIKPDNFYRPSRRPGNIIDTFSLTGLRIVAAKLISMTVAQGEEFYGPLKDVFTDKLRFLVTRTVYQRLHDAFDFAFREEDAEILTDHLAERNARCEFNKIVEYMTGINPDTVEDPSVKATVSRAMCLALLYEGPNAITKIRTVLGSTDPSKAEPGTVRSDFGRDLMRNGAHASDSPENALRERRIVSLESSETQTCDISEIINTYLSRQS